MSRPVDRFASLVEELRQRRVVRALLAYGAGVGVVLEGAEMVFTALALPDLAYRIIVIAAIAGFPVVAALSWVYDLTARGLRRTADLDPEENREPVPVSRYLQLVGAFAFIAAIVLSTAGAVSSLRYPGSDDGRVGLAIFPLRTVGPTGQAWSEGTADLLATALEGTPSLRVVDPWSLWRPLRPEASAAAVPPDPQEAQSLTLDVGAHRFLLGSVVASGSRIELAFRLYRVGRSEPVDAFTVSSGPNGMAEAVSQAAVRVLARVWGPLRPADVPAELDFDATQSPEALKAYLGAKAALRRGMIDSANTAIDRALDLDSAFVLAMVAAVRIKSWGFSLRGDAYTGFFELLGRAEPFEGSLDERSRLRLAAMRASVETNGPAAIEAASRILEIDPLDYTANVSLEYYRRAYGWQLTPPAYSSREMAERMLQLDSTQLPALATREWWAVSLRDTADERVQLHRLARADTTGVVGRIRLRSLRALLADDTAFERMLPELTSVSREAFVDLSRHLRAANVARYRRLLDAIIADAQAPSRPIALPERMRLDVAQGWGVRADSAMEAGIYPENQPLTRALREMFLVAAGLARVADRSTSSRAVRWLTDYVPPDSALAHFTDRPAWRAGWLIGAWSAEYGDTTLAHRWIDVLATFPAGGTSTDYRGALQKDIEARLAIRRGEPEDAAIALERTAMRLWSIHTDNALESEPSPNMRLTLGLLLRGAGRREEAAAMLSSLVLPTSWMGFATARADYELGELAFAAGDTAAARLHFARTVDVWGPGGPPVSAWADRARERLRSLSSE